MKHHNLNYSGGLPLADGDRYYSQDLLRDFWYNAGRSGGILRDLTGKTVAIGRGGAITPGASPAVQVNISELYAYFPYTATIPDSWASLPPTITTVPIDLIRSYRAATSNVAVASYGATLDGVSVNYIKLSYSEVALNLRNRAKKAGSYSAEVSDETTLTIDTTPPTASQVCLGTLVGDGIANLTIGSGRRTEYLAGNTIDIYTQADWDYYFGTNTMPGASGYTPAGWYWVLGAGSNRVVRVPRHTLVRVHANPPDGSALHSGYDPVRSPNLSYTKSTVALMLTGAAIVGDGMDKTIIRDSSANGTGATLGCYTTMEMATGVVGSVSGLSFTVASNAGFFVGQIIYFDVDQQYYEVSAVPGSVTVTVSRTIVGTGAGNIYALTRDVTLSDFTTESTAGNSVAVRATYIAHSRLVAKLVGFNNPGSSSLATVVGNLISLDVEVANLYRCWQNTASCGVVAGMSNAEIHHIFDCWNNGIGGGSMVFNCYNCDIHDIEGCFADTTVGSTLNGGIAVGTCYRCRIHDIRFCSVRNASATAGAIGGAIRNCVDSKIWAIHNCEVTSGGTGQTKGGGIYGCTNCHIEDVQGCKASGGTTSLGGAASTCVGCSFNGAFVGNTDSEVNPALSRDTFDNCTASAWNLTYDGTAATGTGTLNLD
jgi:hypothetical protein